MLLKGVDHAVLDFNGWQGAACIMLDTRDGQVWTDIFCSDNEWIRYRSPKILCVYSKDSFYGRDDKVNSEFIEELVQFAIREEFIRSEAWALLSLFFQADYSRMKYIA